MFNKFSVKSKFLLSLIPIVLASIVVSLFIFKNGIEENLELNKALKIQTTVAEEELAMISMSEHLRGFLLNPKNTVEYDLKKAADDQFSTFSKELDSLTSQVTEIKNLNQEMAKLDSTSLDDKENQVAELVKTDPAKAIAFYLNEYTPVRKIQNENFVKLKKLSQAYSENIIQKDKEQRKSLALMTIALLILSTFAGVLVSYFVALSITKNTNEVLSFFKLTSDELSDQSSALLDKSRSLSDATNLESAAIQETAASIHEITQMADKTTENSNLSRTLSSDSSSKSRDGVSAIEKMIHSIDEINNYQGEIVNVVETSNKKISEIVSVISNIEAKTKVINEIVFQTKLLSFNASVEAARAGENGKGFAVVAEEIGNLANLSGTASSEINTLLAESVRSVNGIVSSTQDSLKRSMDRSKILIQNGKKIAEECSDVLMAIDKSVSNTSVAIEEITIATKEQSRGISEINIAVGQLDNTIQSNSNIAKDAHLIANDLSKKSNELQSRVDDLNLLINGK